MAHNVPHVLVAALLVCAVCGAAASGKFCPWPSTYTGQLITSQPDPSLVLCPEFKDDACCNSTTENNARQVLNTLYSFFGTDCCAKTIKAMFCALHCSPDQAGFITVETSNVTVYDTVQLFVNHDYCQRIYNLCKDHSVAGVKFSQWAASLATNGRDLAEASCYYFRAANHPEYPNFLTRYIPDVTPKVRKNTQLDECEQQVNGTCTEYPGIFECPSSSNGDDSGNDDSDNSGAALSLPLHLAAASAIGFAAVLAVALAAKP